MMLLKRILFCVFGVMQCVYAVSGSKNTLLSTLYIIVAPLCSTFLKRVDFNKAHCSEKWGMQWLASYPVRCDWPNTSSVRRKCSTDDTKNNKPIINETFAASSGNIMTDYNDLYCFFTRCVASRRVNIIISAFVIGVASITLHCSKLAFESSVAETYLQAVSQKHQTCKIGIAPLYRNSLCASQHCRLLFQVQEIVLHKMCCTHSNIWVELFWNSVVNTT